MVVSIYWHYLLDKYSQRDNQYFLFINLQVADIWGVQKYQKCFLTKNNNIRRKRRQVITIAVTLFLFFLQSLSCWTHSSITVLISWQVMRGSVRFDFGWKHMTRQVPCAGADWKSGSLLSWGTGTSSSMAGKSLVKTNVDS